MQSGAGRRDWAGLLAFVVAIACAPAVSSRFVSLDDPLYLSSPYVSRGLEWSAVSFSFTSVSDLYWHPLTWLSHELDFSLFGAAPAGHHFTSVLLHATSAGLLFLVLRRLGARSWFAVGGALVWAVHPLRVESFAWVAERKDVLCAAFFLGAVLAYLRYVERPSRGGYMGWAALGMCALLSKPAAVSIVPVLLILDWWPLRRARGAVWLVFEKTPLVAMTAVVAGLTVYGQRVSGSMSYLADVGLATRIENAAVSLVRYLGRMAYPVNLSCFYPYDRNPAWVVPAMVVAAITGGAIAMRRRWPWLLAGWAWFVIGVLPNLGILQAGRQSMADRFTHLPMIGIVVAVVFSLSAWAGTDGRRNRALAWAACAVLLVLSGLTWRQIGYWHDSVKLAEHALEVENSDFMRANLGTTLLEEQRYGEAEEHFREAIRLNGRQADYHSNLANILLRTGRLAGANAESAIAARLKPEDVAVATTRGLVLLQAGEYGPALEWIRRAVAVGATRGPLAVRLNDWGVRLASHGEPGQAEPLLREAVELDGTLVPARRNLVLALEDEGRRDEARRALEEAIGATGAVLQYGDLARELGVAR